MIGLRNAGIEALPFVLEAESAARAGGYVSGWDETRHRRAICSPDTAYFLVVADGVEQPLGYAIVCGIVPDPVSVELKRLVITEPGRGHGRAALRRLKSFVFDELGGHRLWLDSFVDNDRAIALYRSEGFVEEGVMRESARRDDGYVSQLLMSILAEEHRAA